MKKRVLAVLAAAMLMCGTAYADNTAVINNEQVTVDIDFACAGADFALVMIKNRTTGGYVWAGQSAVENGSLELTASLDSTVAGGYYDVIVTDNNKKSYNASFFYLSASYRDELLGQIEDIIASDDDDRTEQMQKLIEDNDFIFQYDEEKYDYLDDKTAVAEAMLDGTYSTIDDFSDALDKAISDLYEQQLIDEAAEKLGGASASEITGILEEYEETYGITLDDTYYKYADTVNAAIEAADIQKAEDVAGVFAEAMAVPYVNEADRSNILNVIYQNDEYLGVYDRITALDGEVQLAVLKALEQGTFTSAEQMSAAITTAVNNFDGDIADYTAEDEDTSTYTVSKDLLDKKVELIQDMVTEADEIFSDLGNASWAKEAILVLYDMGIVSGRGEGKFAPNDEITRAELTAMLVKAYALTGEGAEGFADVAESDWYYDAVMTARAAGIASGDEDNNFMPMSAVTRQDMSVLIYRAMGTEKASQTEFFADDADISDYARAAVYYMKENGIAAGMEDGTFAPRQTATRAQCAQILYKAIVEGVK
ncbi:MAG: S-layer homology domain-containing protein [Clostridia bacterium]|nr:S-layer homology domain-containing protein [Clostridia bacterium]